MFDLSGRVALVTGGSRDRSGLAMPRFAAAGADVIVNFVSSQAAAEQTSREIAASLAVKRQLSGRT